MKTIYKFGLQLADEQTISMPAGALIRSIQVQRNEICLWAEVDTKAERVDATFYIRGTGHSIPTESCAFLETVQLNNGALVFHIFRKV